MSKKDELKKKAKGKLDTSKKADEAKTAVVVKYSELDKITREIRSDLEEMQDIAEWWQEKKQRVSELKEAIIERLIYVRDNKKNLLGGRNFEDYLSNDIGISKGYFYEQLQAYNLCKEHNRTRLFNEVDPKVLVGIAREKDKDKQSELINKAKELTRYDFKKVRPSDFSEAPPVKINKDKMSIKISDKKMLRAIEQLLKENGFGIEYV